MNIISKDKYSLTFNPIKLVRISKVGSPQFWKGLLIFRKGKRRICDERSVSMLANIFKNILPPIAYGGLGPILLGELEEYIKEEMNTKYFYEKN